MDCGVCALVLTFAEPNVKAESDSDGDATAAVTDDGVIEPPAPLTLSSFECAKDFEKLCMK